MATSSSPSHEGSFEKLRDSICHRLLRDYSELKHMDDKRFFRAGAAEEILRRDRLEALFGFLTRSGRLRVSLREDDFVRRIDNRKLQTFLAILIYAHCDFQALVAFTETLVAGSHIQELTKLPLRQETAQKILGDELAADRFLNHQGYFCAVVLKEKEEVICNESRRLPYLEEKRIGSGAFGNVYRVLIASNHFYDAKKQLSNRKPLWLARKDFELDNAAELDAKDIYEKERDVMQDIVRNVKSNSNIMENLGSLQIGSTYSLFMPIAWCDLGVYMKIKYPATPDQAKKAKIVHCTAGLAGAIAYLHDELRSSNFEELSCFHMDLKPSNILVVIDDVTKEEQWKLSDFNMSRVKAKRKYPGFDQPILRQGRTFDNTYDFNKLFKRRVPDRTDSSLTDPTVNRRGDGTYLAPEASIGEYSIRAESDTWSLGCIVSVVFSYLHGGNAAVTEFGDLRSKKQNDRFFSYSTTREPHKLSDVKIDDAVQRWFRELRSRTIQHNEEEGAIFKDMIKFLETRVLVVDPKQRRATKAKDVELQLIEAYKAYNRMNPTEPLSTTNHSRFLSGIFSKRRKPEEVVQGADWEISLPDATYIQTCEFGSDAHLLLCASKTTLAVYSFEIVQITNNFEDLLRFGAKTLEEGEHSWTGAIAVSAQHIVAATNHREFDCYVYYIPDRSSHTSELQLHAHVQLKLPPIWKLAVSPDGIYLAFVLRNLEKRGNGLLYICRMDQLPTMNAERFSFADSSSSRSSTSTDATLSHNTRPILLPVPAEAVCELKFSKLIALYAVVKPEQNIETLEPTITVLAWSVEDGRPKAHRPCEVEHDGKDDLIHSLFTSFSPHNQELAYTLISQEKRVVSYSWAPNRFTENKAWGYRLVKIIADENDTNFFCFGTREANNNLHLLSFSATPSGDKLKMSKIAKLPNMTPQSKFSASLFEPNLPDAASHRKMLVADVKGRTVRILQFPLAP